MEVMVVVIVVDLLGSFQSHYRDECYKPAAPYGYH